MHQHTVTRAADTGIAAVKASLRALLALPGRMRSVNNFAWVAYGIALTRADC